MPNFLSKVTIDGALAYIKDDSLTQIVNTEISNREAMGEALENEIDAMKPLHLDNVLNYGAVGDGTTNDRDAFNAALAAASENNLIYIPDKTYNLGGYIFWDGSYVINDGHYNTGSGLILSTSLDVNTPAAQPVAATELSKLRGSANTAYGMQGCVYNPLTSRIYVGFAQSSSSVDSAGAIIEASPDLQTVYAVHNGAYWHANDMAMDSARNRLYIASCNDNTDTLIVVDLSTWQIIHEISAASLGMTSAALCQVAYDPDHDIIYVMTNAEQLAAIDAYDFSVISIWKPYRYAYDPKLERPDSWAQLTGMEWYKGNLYLFGHSQTYSSGNSNFIFMALLDLENAHIKQVWQLTNAVSNYEVQGEYIIGNSVFITRVSYAIPTYPQTVDLAEVQLDETNGINLLPISVYNQGYYNIYVDETGANGSGNSVNSPINSLRAAINKTIPGRVNRIYLMSDCTKETLLVLRDNLNIEFIGYNNTQRTIGCTVETTGVNIKASYITFAPRSGPCINLNQGGKGIFDNCVFSPVSHGINCYDNSQALVMNCQITTASSSFVVLTRNCIATVMNCTGTCTNIATMAMSLLILNNALPTYSGPIARAYITLGGLMVRPSGATVVS